MICFNKVNKKKMLCGILIVYLLMIITYLPNDVNADSGLDSSYDSRGSGVESILGSGSSFLSPLLELIKVKPGDSDYVECQIALAIVFSVILYIITAVYIFRLKRDIPKSKKKNLIILGISLVPILIFLLLCLLTKLINIFGISKYVLLNLIVL